MPRLIFDLETRSELDVKEVGPHKYGAHPSTEIICVGYKTDFSESRVWAPHEGPMPPDLRQYLLEHTRNKRTAVAHNAEFELCVWNNSPHSYRLKLNRDFVSCTAARAAAFGYPRKLEILAKAMRLGVEKDTQGHRVMMKMTKPRSAWKKDPSQPKWFEDEIDFLILKEYCRQDIEVEAAVDRILPELNLFERRLWELTCDINSRGIKTDVELIHNTLEMLDYFKEKYTKEFLELTRGAVSSVTRVAKFLEWLATRGCYLNNLQAQTVVDTLKTDLDPDAKRALELRQLLGKSSTTKFQAFKDRANAHGVVKDLLVYSAATPTGRWAGSGVQPQNFPRGTVKDIPTALDYIRLNDPELIDAVYPSPLAMFSSCLRSMIVPASNKKFVCADFAQIETRVLFWLACEWEGLTAFAKGWDLYKQMAVDIFGVKLDEVTPEQRFVGKESVLGCGYGMGPPKFVSQCAAKNVAIPDELGRKAVYAYRTKFKNVVKFWASLENACLYAVKNNAQVRVGKITVNKSVHESFMTIKLPSGRNMNYHFVELRNIETSWGELKLALTYEGIDTKTKQWTRESTYGGKLVENVCQGVARDLMATGILECELLGYESALTVHDELLSNADDFLTVEDFVSALTTLPDWAKGCPIKAEGWQGERYKK